MAPSPASRPLSARILLGAGCLLLLLTAPAPAAAAAWDQARVSALTQQLLRHVSNIKKAVAREWERADKESARYVVLNDLMVLQRRAVVLNGLVRAGEGREGTEHVYRRMRSAVENAAASADDFPEIDQQREEIDRATKVLDELAVFYEPDAKAGDEGDATPEGVQ